MGKGNVKMKAMTMAVAMSMVAGLCPSTVFAATGSQAVKDGVYTATKHVTNNHGANDWEEYDVNVSVQVSGGKITGIDVKPSDAYDEEESSSYFNWAKDGRTRKGVNYPGYTSLIGKDATEETISGWDAVSGATCTSEAVKDAALEAINSKSDTSTVNTDALESAIKDAEALKESDYTSVSWKEMQEKLTLAKEALTAKASQDAVDAAKEALNTAVHALKKAEVTAVKYIKMNVPYNDFYAAYNLTDKAVWEVEDGVDAVSTATTNKFKGTAGLAKGTYNNDKYIMGVTIPVEVSAEDYEKLDASLKDTNDYYFTTLDETPEAYSKLTVKADGSYSFSKISDAKVTNKYLSVKNLKLDESYGDYQITIDGLGTKTGLKVGEDETKDYTLYGAILNTADGKSYGTTCLENIWIGNKVDNAEIAWSIKEGKGLQRAHGSGGTFYQFADMNGAKLTSVTLITDLGTIHVPCDVQLGKYYEGDLSQLSYALENDSKELSISGIPADLKDVKISVSGGLAENQEVKDGKVVLEKAPTAGVKYTITISSSNYPAITRTTSTPITSAEKIELQKWMDKAEKTDGYADNTDLKEHVKEAEDMLKDEAAFSADAEELIGELKDKVKSTYSAMNATATLKGSRLNINLTDMDLSALENPTYTLSYRQGRGMVTFAEGSLDSLAVDLAKSPTEGTEYTLKIVSDNYKDFTTAVKAEAAESTENEYSYVYAGLTWSEYWAAEDVQAAGSTATSEEVDQKGESDKGAFDTVTRATANHGLHRGNFQCNAVVTDTEGNEHTLVSWTSDGNAVFSDGKTYKKEGKVFTANDGTSFTLENYVVTGLKYVPVKVKTDDLAAFKEKYAVVENGETLSGGYGEGKLSAYAGLIANVTEETNGLKTATKNEDGTFSFSERKTGTESGIKDQALKTAPSAEEAGLTVQAANGSFGEFLRVDLNKNYGDLGANMQAVTWKYYGNDATYQNALATYGTKFAADNWMHKSMGIQLGLTKSLRCTLPEGTDGTGYWTITISALGYNDVTYQFQATSDNIVKDADEEITTDALKAAIEKAKALKESDYTADSWANMLTELEEAEEELKAPHSQAVVDEATRHLNAAIDALEKVQDEPVVEVNTDSLEKAISAAKALKEADYTADSWKTLQSALSDAQKALEAKESQDAVDKATDSLNSAIKGLVKNTTVVKKDDTNESAKTDKTTDGTKKGGSKSVQTGDPANVLGWLGLAVSSLGAGAGSFAWRRKKRK